MSERLARVCIVGAGPRGLAVLERICANAGDRQVELHVVDPYPPGAGKVWRTDQDRELLMNTVASQVTMFTDETVEMDGPVLPGPSLFDWGRRHVLPDPSGWADWVRREAGSLGPDSYPTRAFYGCYLRWVFDTVVRNAPGGVRTFTYARQVVDVADHGSDHRQRVLLSDGHVIEGVDAVVFAQGHVPSAATSEEAALHRFSRARGLRYLPPANPADAEMSFVRPGEPVFLRGLGLCFFDYLGLLSARRGGRFERRDGELHYLPSGAEPRIYAGSRRGVPYHARGENEKGAFGRHEPRLLTPATIARLNAYGASNGGLDFRRDVWPLLAREVELVYYRTLLGRRAAEGDVAAFAAAFLALETTAGAQRVLLRRWGFADREHWDWARILNPAGGQVFAGPGEFRSWLAGYLKRDIAQARLGNLSSPVKAAVDVLRDLRNEVRLLVDHGGLTGRSHREDLDGWFTPANAFLSIGPPLRRVEEALALIRAGILDIVGPCVRVEHGRGRRGFEVMSPAVRRSRITVNALIEARLGEPDVRRAADPLLRRMFAAAQARPYVIADGQPGRYETPGLAVTRRPYRIIDGSGAAHPRRFAFGVPTESVHWATAAGVRPGSNSVTLGDADAIARLIVGDHRDEAPVGAAVGATEGSLR
ncbi:FAD/NAD(P)-binding protein [Actinoplanes sp. NPDC051411]|uniref:FAD/NAD(P)-binding protein n=1 Tax=Actinoplanes sp. NPDC051411 TaxID=3155522 RepID=UPI003448B5CA